jgi:hypothetical protein
MCSVTGPPATTAVRLLPGYDQVLGPVTADAHLGPLTRRALLSRQANIVTAGGVLSRTWSIADDQHVLRAGHSYDVRRMAAAVAGP